LRSMQVW